MSGSHVYEKNKLAKFLTYWQIFAGFAFTKKAMHIIGCQALMNNFIGTNARRSGAHML